MLFADHFSNQSDQYALLRPHYPAALFAFIASVASGLACAWDCGTGNGQAAVSLAQHFATVYATDPSASQIAKAIPYAGVHYSVQPAEATNFRDHTVDAVCVAQALHWFKLPEFFAEAQRVMRPAAVFAAWGYSWFTVTPQFDAAFHRLILDAIAPDWPPQNALLWREYQDIGMPFQPILAPTFTIQVTWNLDQLLAYVGTWSATRHAIERLGRGFLDAAADGLMPFWETPATPRRVIMPIHLIVGRNAS